MSPKQQRLIQLRIKYEIGKMTIQEIVETAENEELNYWNLCFPSNELVIMFENQNNIESN